MTLATSDTSLKFKCAVGPEYSGPCPFCGGTNRFNVQPARWLCRECTQGQWQDSIEYAMRRSNLSFVEVAMQYLGEDAPKIDPEVVAERIRLQKDHEERRLADIAHRLKEFSIDEVWKALNRRMNAENRAQWRAWGIPDEWQNRLQLGFVADKHYYSDGQEQISSAFTIPYFHNTTQGAKFSTMQYRLTDPAHPNDRYRFENGLPASFYETTPDSPIKDSVIVCEGAKKAAVFKIYIDTNDKSTVLAVPGRASWGGIVEKVKHCGVVYVMLDPDATTQAEKFAREIGSAARIVSLHVKIDDGILQHGLGKTELASAFRWAQRVGQSDEK